jgi:RNA processing factor Prp31
VDNTKEEAMTERRPATTIEGLDIHLWHVMEKLIAVEERLNKMVTIDHMNAEIQQLRKELREQAPQTIWRRMTEIAIGLTALAGAFAVVVAIFRWLKIA